MTWQAWQGWIDSVHEVVLLGSKLGTSQAQKHGKILTWNVKIPLVHDLVGQKQRILVSTSQTGSWAWHNLANCTSKRRIIAKVEFWKKDNVINFEKAVCVCVCARGRGNFAQPLNKKVPLTRQKFPSPKNRISSPITLATNIESPKCFLFHLHFSEETDGFPPSHHIHQVFRSAWANPSTHFQGGGEKTVLRDSTFGCLPTNKESFFGSFLGSCFALMVSESPSFLRSRLWRSRYVLQYIRVLSDVRAPKP